MELAPLLASVCTICGEEMPSKRVPTPCWAPGETFPECLLQLEIPPRGLLCAWCDGHVSCVEHVMPAHLGGFAKVQRV